MAAPTTGAIVVAAGRSSRLPGDLPKPYLRVGRSTVLGHTLRAFAAARSIDEIVVVVAEEHLRRARRIARAVGSVSAVVVGGARRQDSVELGLAALGRRHDVVLVHDGARPLVLPELIDETAAAARRLGAAVAAAPVADTLKRVRGKRIVETVDRAELWGAETPQGFRRGWLEEGFRRAAADGVEVTDDAGLIERLGRKVGIVPSTAPNLKVTRAADLTLVAALLAGRKR